jgi:hypothetical protein
MKRGSTIFLRLAIFILGIAVLALCIFGLPVIAREVAEFIPEYAYLKYPYLLDLYVTGALFFTALYQALKLLKYIDVNKAFSELSVKALRIIKRCAIGMSALYLAGMPVVFLVADKDDAPGLIVMGMAFSCAPIVVAVFAAVLQKLVQNAVDMKSEIDLTV